MQLPCSRRLCAAIEPAVQGASEAARRLQQLELDVAVAAEAADAALRSPPGKPASAKAAAAAAALRTAVKWAALAAATTTEAQAAGGPDQQDEAPPAAAELLALAAALLEQLPASQECQLSMPDCAEQLQLQQQQEEEGLKPVQPQVLQVWLAEAMQPSAAVADSGGAVSVRALRSSSQSNLPGVEAGALESAASEEVLAAWLHASASAACNSNVPGQLGASSSSSSNRARTSSRIAGAAVQTQQPLQVPHLQLLQPQPRQQQEQDQQEQRSMPGSALAAGGAASSASRQRSRSSNAQVAPRQLAASSALLASRVCSAAAAMTSKQERALARAQQAGVKPNMPCCCCRLPIGA